jgi:hypothetical protein
MNLKHETADANQKLAPFKCKHCGDGFEPAKDDVCPERLVLEAMQRVKVEIEEGRYKEKP